MNCWRGSDVLKGKEPIKPVCPANMKHILITYPQGANFFWLYHYSIASKGFAKTRVQIILMRTVSFGPPSGFKWHKTDFIWFFILLFHVIFMLDDLWGSFLCTILILATLNISQLHPFGSTRTISVIGCVQVEVPEPPKAPEVPKVPELPKAQKGIRAGKGWWTMMDLCSLLAPLKEGAL